MPKVCCAIDCTSSTRRNIEGITFHRFPTDPERRAQWVAAVGRGKDWRPKPLDQLCSLHFAEDAFDRCSTMRVFLQRNALPTIFPVRKISEESKTLPTKRAGMPVVLAVTPFAVEKVRKLYPWPEPEASEAQVTKESENQPRERLIAPQEAGSDIESVSIGKVRSIKMELDWSDESNSDEPEVPSKDSESAVENPKKLEQKATETVDGATSSVLIVNLVCPNCQKACKVSLNVTPQPSETNAPIRLQANNKPKMSANNNRDSWTDQVSRQPLQTPIHPCSDHEPKKSTDNNEDSLAAQVAPQSLETNTPIHPSSDNGPKKSTDSNEDSLAAQVKKLEKRVLNLETAKLNMLRKVNALNLSVHRLRARNYQLEQEKRDCHHERDAVEVGSLLEVEEGIYGVEPDGSLTKISSSREDAFVSSSPKQDTSLSKRRKVLHETGLPVIEDTVEAGSLMEVERSIYGIEPDCSLTISNSSREVKFVSFAPKQDAYLSKRRKLNGETSLPIKEGFIHQALKDNCYGAVALLEYRNSGHLSPQNQQIVAECVMLHEIKGDLEKKINAARFIELAEKIEEYFPTESVYTYYIPYHKDKDNKKHSASGKLVDLYYNMRRRAAKVLIGGKPAQKSSVEGITSEESA